MSLSEPARDISSRMATAWHLLRTLLGTGVFVFLIGVIADLISTNRKLLEHVDWKIKQLQEAVQEQRVPPEPQVVVDQRRLVDQLAEDGPRRRDGTRS